MNFNFELILFYATLISGILMLLDILFFAKRRKRLADASGQSVKLPIIFDYAHSFFPILLIVFLLRSFLFEPFRIPSGSLEPTLLTGDFIIVNKFDYGVRLPVIHNKLFGEGEPKRGDIMVFRWPLNPSIDFIKRVIGVPGDKISYLDKTLYVNGKKIPQDYLKTVTINDENGEHEVKQYEENLLGIKHKIYIDPARTSADLKEVTVPEGSYFVMGDHRDDSEDSRYWGFVPEQNIIGKAVYVWMSWNNNDMNVRWHRIGKLIG